MIEVQPVFGQTPCQSRTPLARPVQDARDMTMRSVRCRQIEPNGGVTGAACPDAWNAGGLSWPWRTRLRSRLLDRRCHQTARFGSTMPVRPADGVATLDDLLWPDPLFGRWRQQGRSRTLTSPQRRLRPDTSWHPPV